MGSGAACFRNFASAHHQCWRWGQQHPTQTMLDLYSIKKTQGALDNLTITMVGDLKYGRTVHSLITAMAHFNPTFRFHCPKELELPKYYQVFCNEKGSV